MGNVLKIAFVVSQPYILHVESFILSTINLLVSDICFYDSHFENIHKIEESLSPSGDYCI